MDSYMELMLKQLETKEQKEARKKRMEELYREAVEKNEIMEEQEFALDHVLYYHGEIMEYKLGELIDRMMTLVEKWGAEPTGFPVTVLYHEEDGYYEGEIYLPLDREISPEEDFCYKEKVRIYHALKIEKKGKIDSLQDLYDKLEAYRIAKGWKAQTFPFSVTTAGSDNEEDWTTAVYVGINKNVI